MGIAAADVDDNDASPSPTTTAYATTTTRVSDAVAGTPRQVGCRGCAAPRAIGVDTHRPRGALCAHVSECLLERLTD